MAHDVLVIGGGPAGLSAALNVRARGRSVLVVSNPLEENPLWRAETARHRMLQAARMPPVNCFRAASAPWAWHRRFFE